jgi:hypothetical protein
LGFLSSHRAKAKVRSWFNALVASQTMAKGRELVERLLQREGKTALKLDELAEQLGFPAAAQLFEVVGKDEFSLKTIETFLHPPAPLLDGRPIWTASRRGGAEENARKAFARNGESFGATNLNAYVRKARAFIEAPPSGAQRLTRRNGDVLMYHPGSNTFAVASRDGTPRAFFQPDDGPAYWEVQKARESQRRTASTGAARSSDG